MFEFLIVLLEVIAFASLVMFSGTLESKYYEDKGQIKYIEVTKWVALVALIVMLLPAGVHVRFIWAHVIYHLSVLSMCYVGWKEFKAMRFKYPTQYRSARWLLSASIMLESLAIALSMAAARRSFSKVTRSSSHFMPKR